MSRQTLEPLAYSLRGQIVDRLRSDILCSRLAEGESLTENKLVERFGVSRTPVREALLQLAHEGLLECRPNKQVRVAHRPPDAVQELIVPIRRHVETFALRMYFSDLTTDDFSRWGEILKQLRVACTEHDFAAIAEHDIAFHRSIVSRAGQADLEAIWLSLVARVRSHFWETQRRNYSDPFEIYEEHAQIIKVVESRDLEAAVKALEENIA